MKINQYSVYWTCLDPTLGAEINKTRPCVVMSPVEMNEFLQTIIVVPVTSRGREGYPTRTKLDVNKISGWIVLDQIRAIDKDRLSGYIGDLSPAEIKAVKNVLQEMLID
jgi:mRNA interferase MazF